MTNFLNILFGEKPPGYLPIWTKQPNETQWISGQDLTEAAGLVHNLAKTRDVYFGLGLQPKNLGKRSRGKADQVIAIPGVWADIDIADAAHKNPNLPTSIEEAMSLISQIPLAPTLVVNSGHGMHVYWLFKNLWVFQDSEEREHAQTVVRAFQAGLIHLAQQRGWTMDNTSDLARVLRIPGTINRKREPVPVSIIEQNLAHRYQPSDFEEVFKKELPSLSEQGNKTTVQPDLDFSALPPADLAPIVEGCAWLAHCQQDAQTLAEPEWYAMLSIVGRCENGAILAQEWSASYPDYSREETDTKFDRALTQGGPRKCDNIQQMTGGRFCQDCSHAGTITSPIQLGNQNALSADDRKLITNPVEELNQTHAIIMSGGKCRILNEEQDLHTGYKIITFSTKRDFELRYAPYKKQIDEKKWAPISNLWLNSRKRRKYAGVVFLPQQETPGYYNLWQGFSVEAKEGDCHLFLEHIRDNIADGKQEHFDYIIRWMAHVVQHPDQPVGVALVLRGKQGTGKSLMCKLFGSLFGPHYALVTSTRQLVGNFNAHLQGVVLVLADEAFWVGDKASEGALKSMVTGDSLQIEAKGQDIINVPNYLNLMMASNEDWVVPAGPEERRFCVFGVGEGRMQDTEYFKALMDQMDNGGREALLYYLMNYDLSGVNLLKFPQTEALMENKLHSMKAVEKFWLDKLMEGALGRPTLMGRGCVEKRDLYTQYIELAKNIGQTKRSAETTLGRYLKKLVPDLREQNIQTNGRSTKYLFFPSLQECRESFNRFVNYSFEWPEDGGQWMTGTPDADGKEPF